MNGIRTAQAPASTTSSLRQLLTDFGERLTPHTPDVGPSDGNPLRAILGEVGQGGSSEGGDGADWRKLMLGEPEVLDGDGLLFEQLSRDRTMSF